MTQICRQAGYILRARRERRALLHDTLRCGQLRLAGGLVRLLPKVANVCKMLANVCQRFEGMFSAVYVAWNIHKLSAKIMLIEPNQNLL